jgi:hypothetical protein
MTAFVFLLPAHLSAQTLDPQAWTQKDGGYVIKLWLSRTDTRQEFNTFAKRTALFSEYPGVMGGEYASTDINLDAEYGVSEDFTIIGMTRLRSSTSEYSDSELVQRPNGGFGDVYLAGRLNLIESPISAVAQVGWNIPLADTGSINAVALGAGTMDFDARVAVGYKLPIPGFSNYIQSMYGYVFRGGNFGNEIIYLEEVGFMLFGDHIGLHGVFDGSITQGPVAPPDTSVSNTGFGFLNNQTYSRLTAGVFVPVGQKIRLFFDWTTVMNGRATFAGNTVAIGVAFNRVWDTPLGPKGK